MCTYEVKWSCSRNRPRRLATRLNYLSRGKARPVPEADNLTTSHNPIGLRDTHCWNNVNTNCLLLISERKLSEVYLIIVLKIAARGHRKSSHFELLLRGILAYCFAWKRFVVLCSWLGLLRLQLLRIAVPRQKGLGLNVTCWVRGYSAYQLSEGEFSQCEAHCEGLDDGHQTGRRKILAPEAWLRVQLNREDCHAL
jgi:hypothetical protein